MRHASNEVLKGKNLDVNLSKLGTGLMNIFNNYSFIRLSMNYYTYYEMVSEKTGNDEVLKNLIDRFNNVIKDGVLNPVMGDQQVTVLEEIQSIRKEVIAIMKGLTSLADIFNIYEYALNRVEYNFKDGSHVRLESDERFADNIMAYILSDKDNVVMNTRICEIVRQLPVRMVKAKFYEMVEAGLKVYKGSEKQSVNDFLYMLRTSAMLDIDENALKLSDDIAGIIENFKNVDFSNINAEEYETLSNKLTFATDFVENSVNKYMMFAELINDVYVIVLSNHYISEFPSEHNSCVKIIEVLYDRFLSEDKLLDDIEIENYFYDLEGKQEEYYRYFTNVTPALEMVIENYMDTAASLMLDKMYNSLNVIKQLESGSIFIEFDNETISGEADENYIQSKFETLKADFNDFFKNNCKLINRAVMAHVLSSLPIFFNNVDEIRDYVKGSVSQCSDKAEKLACAEIFQSLTEE